MTIPVFVLVLFLFDKFLSEKTSTPKNAAFLGLALALGIWSKYSFMALLPAVFVIFAFLWWKRAWNLKRFVAICALSLVLPSALVLYSYWASTRVKDSVPQTMWIPKGGAPSQPETTWKDLFSVKPADLQLFSAPEFFRRKASDPYPSVFARRTDTATSRYGIWAFLPTSTICFRICPALRVSTVILSLISKHAAHGRLRSWWHRCPWELSGPSWP